MPKTIDPRTTRKHVRYEVYQRNAALYAQYRVLAQETDAYTGKPSAVLLEKKPEHCGQTKH